MTNQDLIKELYEEMALFNQNSSFDWSDVLEAIKPELDKCVTNECISLKSAIKVYLDASNDYDNHIFTKMCEVQKELDDYYDGLIKQFIIDNSSLSAKSTDKMIRDLRVHFDLYSEIVEYLMAGKEYRKKLIDVEGYTAEKLCDKFNLSIVEAYNYLIYLREDTENMALHKLVDELINYLQETIKDNKEFELKYTNLSEDLKKMIYEIDNKSFPNDLIILPMYNYLDRNIDEPQIYDMLSSINDWYKHNYRKTGMRKGIGE